MFNLKTINKIIGGIVLGASTLFMTTSIHAQTVYPDLDSILTCTQDYMDKNYSNIIQSNKPIIVAGTSLAPCKLYKSTLNDYNLVLGKLVFENKKTPSAVGYLVVNKKLNDNEVATIKHIAQNSQGFNPGYLDANYNFVTFFLQSTVFEGRQQEVLMQRETPMPVLKNIVANPERVLVLEVIVNK